MPLETNSGTVNPQEEKRSKIKAELKSFGSPEVPELVEHFVVLDEKSEFNNDTRTIGEGVRNVMKLVDSFTLTPIEKKRVALAVYLHDVGKSSSSERPECQLAVVKLFSVEGVLPTKTVQEILEDRNNFPNETINVKTMLSELKTVGVTPKMPMRDFWDKHAFWTKEILDGHPGIFDKETKIIAASHHLDRTDKEINPYNIDLNNVEEVSNELKYSIFLLMAVDKYQAISQRVKDGKEIPHAEAMQFLRVYLGRYDGDEIMEIIIKTIGQLGATNSLFPESKKLYQNRRKSTIIKK